MSNYPFSIPHNPNSLNLPIGKPHFANTLGQSQGTKHGPPPTFPPSSTIPQFQIELSTEKPGAFFQCLNRDTYIHLVNRSEIWFHPTYIDSFATSGYIWNGFSWIAWETDLDKIVAFQCAV